MAHRYKGSKGRSARARTGKRFNKARATDDRLITSVFVPGAGVFMPSGKRAGGPVPMLGREIGSPIPGDTGGGGSVSPSLFIASHETGGLGATGSMVAIYNPVTDTFNADYNDIRAITDQATEGTGYGGTAAIAWGIGSSIAYGKFGSISAGSIFQVDALDSNTRLDLLPSHVLGGNAYFRGSNSNKALFTDRGNPPNFQLYNLDTGLWEAQLTAPVGSRFTGSIQFHAFRDLSPNGKRFAFYSNPASSDVAYRGAVVYYDSDTASWSNLSRPAGMFNVDYAQLFWLDDDTILLVSMLAANNNYLGLWTYSLDPDNPAAGSWVTHYDVQDVGPSAFQMVAGGGTLLDSGTKYAVMGQGRQLALIDLTTTNNLLGYSTGPGAGAINIGAYPWIGGNTSSGFVCALSQNIYRVVYDSSQPVASSLTGFLAGDSPIAVPAWYNTPVGFWTPHS